MGCLYLQNNEKLLFGHDSVAKKQSKKPKKKAGRKRKYDIIRRYSDIEDDIDKGYKIFKVIK